ncbi:hypothetical protein [Nocardioides sp. KR10-350]|uniref:hypothetical protein n=1 Tax=Nocardioides cheoyonin TaxID=3156615 RepID=UPI0032B475CE
MAIEYMFVRIVKSGGSGQERMEASGLVAGVETFARSDDQAPQDYNSRDGWVRAFVSRVVSELGDDDWTVVTTSDLRQARAFQSVCELELVMSRTR